MTLIRTTALTLALAAPALAQDKSSQTSADSMGANHGHDATTNDTGAQKAKAAPVPRGSKKSKNGDPKTP